jgi:hypothetical protein
MRHRLIFVLDLSMISPVVYCVAGPGCNIPGMEKKAVLGED